MTTPSDAHDGGRGLPLRLAVVGASVAYMCEPWELDGHRGPWPLQLCGRLHTQGVEVDLAQFNRWYGQISDVWDDYERIRDHAPDVIVFNLGLAECEPRVLPMWLVRHFAGWRRSTHRPAILYRDRIAPRLWRVVRRLQQVGTRMAGQRGHRLPPRRFVREFERVVRVLLRETPAVILLLDIDVPGDRFEHWMPGLRERVEHYNRLIADVAAGVGDRVRVVHASGATAGETLFDGRHRSPAGHAALAALLADEVLGTGSRS